MIDLSSAKHLQESKFEFNGQAIYIKRSNDYREFVAEGIAKFLDINTIHYEIGIRNGNQITFSESFYNEDETYVDGGQLLSSYLSNLADTNYLSILHLNNLTDIFCALKSLFDSEYNSDIQKIKYDLVKMFCFDILLRNYDRETPNWGIISKNKEIRLAPMFDNESILTGAKFSISMGMDRDNNEVLFTELLEKFLSTSDSTFRVTFFDMYDKLTLEALESVFKEVEKGRNITIESNYRSEALNNYNKHRSSLQPVVEQYRQGKKL